MCESSVFLCTDPHADGSGRGPNRACFGGAASLCVSVESFKCPPHTAPPQHLQLNRNAVLCHISRQILQAESHAQIACVLSSSGRL